MARKMHTFRPRCAHTLGCFVAACAIVLGTLSGGADARAQDLATNPTSVMVATKGLPANFADTLQDTGLVLLGQENLGTLGMVLFELRIEESDTADSVFERLQRAFPGHAFEWMKSDALDYELSAF